jgi:voltage-gated potassium channel
VRLPEREPSPARKIGQRVGLAVTLVVIVALAAYFGRDGYVDSAGDEVSLLDSFYYATVSITTTGYGDVRPESDGARLVTTLLVTPLRVIFLILLVGTTLELLAERTRQAYRVQIWRRRLKDHTIICGFGTKGRAAARTLVARGLDREQIVVIDNDSDARAQAEARGFATLAGDATSADVLERAGVRVAGAVIVAPNRDDTAVLITLTARELNAEAAIVSAVREEENVHLLHQSGASTVITSSGAAGRLLGLATQTPRLVQVLEDLISVGEGLDVGEREVTPEDAGPLAELEHSDPIIAVVRDGKVHRFDDPEVAEVRVGDRLVYLHSHDQA